MLFLILYQTEVNSQNRTGNLHLTAVHRKKKSGIKRLQYFFSDLEKGWDVAILTFTCLLRGFTKLCTFPSYVFCTLSSLLILQHLNKASVKN